MTPKPEKHASIPDLRLDLRVFLVNERGPEPVASQAHIRQWEDGTWAISCPQLDLQTERGHDDEGLGEALIRLSGMVNLLGAKPAGPQ